MIFKRIIPAFLVICTLFALSACKPEDAEWTTVAAEIETEVPKEERLILAEDGKTDFKIIRSENATGYALDTAVAFNKKMKEEISPDFKITDDWINPKKESPEKEREILLFKTNRAESLAAIAELDFEGYIIRVTDYKIVIAGTSPAACNEALYHFVDVLIPEHIEKYQHCKAGKRSWPW